LLFDVFLSLTPISPFTWLEKKHNELKLPAVAGRMRPTISPTRLVSRMRLTNLAEPASGFGPVG